MLAFDSIFWIQGISGGATIRVPHPTKGHREYHEVWVSGRNLEILGERIARGETCDDIREMIEPPKTRRRSSPRGKQNFRKAISK
jgi:hypothetical protein